MLGCGARVQGPACYHRAHRDLLCSGHQTPKKKKKKGKGPPIRGHNVQDLLFYFIYI